MKPQISEVNAIFLGHDGKGGFQKQLHYTLNVTVFKGRIVVELVSGENAAPEVLTYDTLFDFLLDWANVTAVSVNEYDRDLTFGEKAAGIKFNPGGHAEVDLLKRKSADLIDLCNDARELAGRGEKGRYYSTAITYQEISQMEAVKAATWEHDKQPVPQS